MSDDFICDKLAFEGAQLYSSKDYKAAIDRFKNAIQIGTSNKRMLSSIYVHLGASYYNLKQYEESLFHFYEDLNCRAIKDEIGEGRAMGNISNVLRTCERFEESIEMATSQLKLGNSIRNRGMKGSALWTLAIIHLTMAKKLHAVQGRFFNDFFDKSVRYFKNYMQLCPHDSRVLSCLGTCYFLSGNYVVGKKYYKLRLDEAHRLGDKSSASMALINLGSCCLLLEEYSQAVLWFEEGLKSAEGRYRHSCLLYLAHSHWMAGEAQKAIESHKTIYAEANSRDDLDVMCAASLALSECYSHCGRVRDAVHYGEEHYRCALRTEDEEAVEAARSWLKELSVMPAVNESLGDLIERVDGGRLFDQRVSPLKSDEGASMLEDLFDRMQLMRIDDQRAEFSEESRKGSQRSKKFFKRLRSKN